MLRLGRGADGEGGAGHAARGTHVAVLAAVDGLQPLKVCSCRGLHVLKCELPPDDPLPSLSTVASVVCVACVVPRHKHTHARSQTRNQMEYCGNNAMSPEGGVPRAGCPAAGGSLRRSLAQLVAAGFTVVGWACH